MNRENYLTEVEKRINGIFSASKEGYKTPPVERHRLEGFMNAGVFMGIVDNSELSSLMDKIHMRVFGKTIQQRKEELSGSLKDEVIDYSFYELPTYIRKGK